MKLGIRFRYICRFPKQVGSELLPKGTGCLMTRIITESEQLRGEIEPVISELRLYCLMRTDLDMPVGKMLVQAGHAFATVLHQSDPEIVKEYFSHNQPKISLRAKNLAMIERAARECMEADINHFMVVDAGRTVFTEPTITCIGIGPIFADDLPRYVGRLRLF